MSFNRAELKPTALNWLAGLGYGGTENKATDLVKLDKTPTRLNYVPHQRQIEFHVCDRPIRLYVGGNRSGKSVAGAVECLWYALGIHPYKKLPWNPPLKGRVVAVDFPSGVQKIVLPIFKELLASVPQVLAGGTWEAAYAKQAKILTFANGSEIDFTSSDQALDKFAGIYRHFIAFDEECPESVWIENRARLVDYAGHAWFALTPIQGMSWVYRKLYLPGKGINDRLSVGETKKDSNIGVIEVNTNENPYISKEALASFSDNLSESEREIRIGGKFISLTGLVYPNFGNDNLIKLQEEPTAWVRDEVMACQGQVQIVVSMDHGLRNPSAWLWHLIRPNGSVVTFDELYEREKTIDEMVKLVEAINSRYKIRPLYYVGDPAIRARSAITGTSIQEEYSKRGIGIVPANNDVAAGIERVKVAINNGWLVTDNCRSLIWEMQGYVWATWKSQSTRDKQNEPDKPLKRDDHLVDSLRYMFSNRPELLAKPLKPMIKRPIREGIDWVEARKRRDYWKIQESKADAYLGQI